MKFNKNTILFRTIVGSHMWGQHHSESDTDMFEVYVVDTRSILLGNRHDRGHHSEEEKDGVKEEKDSYEIGHVIEQLKKGNINFLWGVMSPHFDLVTTNIDPNMWDLRRITRENLSKATMHSVRGFVIHNLKHWFGIILDKVVSIDGDVTHCITKRKEPKLLPKDKRYWKIINTCARTLGFGIELLEDCGKTFFCYCDHPKGAISTGELILMLNDLEKAYKTSALPDKPNPDPFDDFLIGIRRREWLIDVVLNGLKENDMTVDEFAILLKSIKSAREDDLVEI